MITVEQLQTWSLYIGLFVGVLLVFSALLLMFAQRQMAKLNIPPNADFTTTMQHTPLAVVIAIDLLDLALDVFALPIVWIVLNQFGLKALRNASSIEAFIPFTGPIPTFTIAWIAINYLNLRI